jgi:hypothetical protein
MEKLLLANGHKARQCADHEDRAWEFSDALRNWGIAASNLYFVLSRPVMVEHTLANREVNAGYLRAVDDRRIDRDKDDLLIAKYAKMLTKTAFLLVCERGLVDDSLVNWRLITGKREEWQKGSLRQFMGLVLSYH